MIIKFKFQRKLAEEAARDLNTDNVTRPSSTEPGVKRKMAPSKPTHSSHPSSGRLDQIQKGTKRAKIEAGAEGTRANGMPMVNKLKQMIDPSQSEKFQFKNDMAKPGAEYLEARTNEKDHQRPDAHFRLFSTQHRCAIYFIMEMNILLI